MKKQIVNSAYQDIKQFYLAFPKDAKIRYALRSNKLVSDIIHSGNTR